MRRPIRIVSALIGAAGLLLGSAPSAAQDAGHAVQARLGGGSITGIVSDERGGVLSGVMISALGATLASTLTDDSGRFTLAQLPPGEYLLRAHLRGFSAAPGQIVQVGRAPAVHRFELRRLGGAVGTAVGTAGAADAPVTTRPIIAAGFDLPRGTDTAARDEADEASTGEHPHGETAWRLRHIKRSILKDAAPIVVLAGDPELSSGSSLGRAVGSAASVATSFLADLPLSGEVNILTTGAVAPGAVLSATAFPRGVAYLSLTAPGAGGDWSVRAAMSEGDLSSWIVSGAFASNGRGVHAYGFGLSYSTQEYAGGNPAALASVAEGSRNVGELYAFDRWALTDALSVEYGGRYAHYDYLDRRALLSPRLAVEVEPLNRTRLRATASQRMLAPGAEEFLAKRTPGPSLPPERTFAPLGAPTKDMEAFRVERARTYDVALERDLGAIVLGVGRFHQSVDDQLVTLFGLDLPGGPRSVGHYYVGTAGSFDADGWAVRLDTRPDTRIQASIHYSLTRARWLGRGDLVGLRAAAPASIRPEMEDLHDVTSSITADIEETATRVFVLYKVNSGYVRNPTLDRPGLDGRFELQVNQGLPLNFAGTKWEVLVGVRNLFRDPTDPASVYDELLVVKPPMRVVGGFLVKF